MARTSLKQKKVLAALLILRRRRKRRVINRSTWAQSWISNREEQGAFQNLVKELRENDKKMYKRYFRMNEETFQLLLGKIKALISKEDTKMRKSIPPEERLRITLRFLATGKVPVIINAG